MLTENTSKRREISNWIKTAVKSFPEFRELTQSVLSSRGELAHKILNRVLRRQTELYPIAPSYLKDRGFAEEEVSGGRRFLGGAEKQDTKREDKRGRSCALRLATKDFIVMDEIDWEHPFEDSEDHEALHRWGWLLSEASQRGKSPDVLEWGLGHVRAWMTRYLEKIDNSLKWNAYSASERICNLILFANYMGATLDSELEYGIRRMTDHVAGHLEYYGSKKTFNHILNNARALYIAGRVLSEPYLSETGGEILKRELPQLVTKDGFLREGSSHYHFLITRWLLEVGLIALKTEDKSFVECFYSTIARMVARCHFFLLEEVRTGRYTFPRIGDVSPDCSPDWLADLPFSEIAQYFLRGGEGKNQSDGCASLLAVVTDRIGSLSGQGCAESTTASVFPESGWYRFTQGEITLFVYCRTPASYDQFGHHHRDVMSFCMYVGNEPILADPGRYSYENSEFGLYGQSARAHNVVMLDGLEPAPRFSLWRSARLSRKHCVSPDISWQQSKNSLQVNFVHRGYERLSSERCAHRRTIEIEELTQKIKIQDSFSGEMKHRVESFYHWGPSMFIDDVEGDAAHWLLRSGVRRFHIYYSSTHTAQMEKYRGALHPIGGWYFPEYGRRLPSTSMRMSAHGRFPFTQELEVRWEDV